MGRESSCDPVVSLRLSATAVGRAGVGARSAPRRARHWGGPVGCLRWLAATGILVVEAKLEGERRDLQARATATAVGVAAAAAYTAGLRAFLPGGGCVRRGRGRGCGHTAFGGTGRRLVAVLGVVPLADALGAGAPGRAEHGVSEADWRGNRVVDGAARAVAALARRGWSRPNRPLRAALARGAAFWR